MGDYRSRIWGHTLKPLYFAFFLSLLLFQPSSSAARIYVYSDFDNSLVEALRGAFKTHFRLYRITYRSNVLQSPIEGPETIDVSPRDLYRLVDREGRSLLARGEGAPGPIGIKFKLEDGTIIEPGNYMIVAPQTFEKFLIDNRGKQNHLLNDLKAAFEADPSGDKIRGKAWPLMQLMLAHPETAKYFGILSARAHARSEWIEMFEHLLAHKNEATRILHLPDSRNIHGVSHEDYTVLTTSYEITKRKVEFVKQVTHNLQRRLNDEAHTIVLPEDDQRTIDAMTKFAQAEANRNIGPIKFVIWNLGFRDEIEARPFPEIAVIEANQPPRAATLEDIVGPLDRLSPEQQKLIPQINAQLSAAFVPDVSCSVITHSGKPIGERGE